MAETPERCEFFSADLARDGALWRCPNDAKWRCAGTRKSWKLCDQHKDSCPWTVTPLEEE